MKKIYSHLLILILILPVVINTVPTKVHATGMPVIDFSVLGQAVKVDIKTVIEKTVKLAGKRLANKVLKKTLQKTINWSLTGFGPWGSDSNQPSYIQNRESLVKNIEDSKLIKLIDDETKKCDKGLCPYSKDLAKSLITEAKNDYKSTGTFDLDKVTPNWEKFTQGKFSEGGGWNTFESYISNPKNNSIGNYLTTKFELKQKKEESVSSFKEEATQNNGFMSIKKCVAYADGKEPTSEIDFSKFSKKTNGVSQDIGDIPKFDDRKVYSVVGDKVKYGLNVFELKTSMKISKESGYSMWEIIAPPVSESDNDYWKFVGKTNGGQITNNVSNVVEQTYALPGMTVDNCLRYEVTTPGQMAKDMLAKSLNSTIDKKIADTSTGDSLIDGLVDMASSLISNGLDKLITKATTKTSTQKIYQGGFADEGNTTFLGFDTGTLNNNAWYSDNLEYISIQDPSNPKKISDNLENDIKNTQDNINTIKESIELAKNISLGAKKLDRCLPGPDVGFESRLEESFQKASEPLQKVVSGTSKEDSDYYKDNAENLKKNREVKEKQITDTKKNMRTSIPSSILIMNKINSVIEEGQIQKALEIQLLKNEEVIDTLNSIKKMIESVPGTIQLSQQQINSLKEKYSIAQPNIPTLDVISENLSNRNELLFKYSYFDENNSDSLINICIEERRDFLTDEDVAKDLGRTLYCPWQTTKSGTSFDLDDGIKNFDAYHNYSFGDTVVYNGLIFKALKMLKVGISVNTNAGNGATPDSDAVPHPNNNGTDSSSWKYIGVYLNQNNTTHPFDPTRINILPQVGDKFNFIGLVLPIFSNGQDFKLRCDSFYRAESSNYQY
jgi:hypothetical protein